MSEQLLPVDTPLSAGLGRDLVGVIRRMILSGRLPAGQRLMPRDLQDMFGVSVIPVREALRTLEAEGLVTTAHRRGTRVSSLSLAELRDVYALRRMIEPPLASRAAELATPKQIQRARNAFEAMEATDGEQVEAWLQAHQGFHWALMDVDLGEVSARVIRQLWSVSDRYVAMSLSAFRVDKPARQDHRALMDAFDASDGPRIALELEEHLHLVEASIIGDFQEGPE